MIECPKCGRTYWMDTCLSELKETIASEKKYGKRAFCGYCQKPTKENR